MKLCDEFVWADDPENIYPASEHLQQAIHDRVERVRATAQEVAMIDLDPAIAGSTHSGSSRQQSG